MKSYFLPLLFLPGFLFSQNMGTERYYWASLAKMTMKTEYDKATGNVNYVPVYGKVVRELVGKEIYLKGYALPVPSREGTFILSAYPFSTCYYCGGAGPETVIEVHPKTKINTGSSKPIMIKGKLALNEPYDMLLLPYFLKDAEPYKQ